MTAINVLCRPDAVHLCTDGATYLADGAIAWLGSKVYAAPHLPMAIAGRGVATAVDRIGPLLASRCATFDDVVATIERTLPALFDDFLAYIGARDEKQEFVIAGWSKGEAQAYYIRTFADEAERDMWGQRCELMSPAVPPYTLLRLQGVATLPLFHELPSANGDEELMVRIMQAQRERKHLAGHIVGGFVQLTTITENEIAQRIAHRWPEDERGHRIASAERVYAMLSPIAVSKVKVSPIDAEMQRLGIGVERIAKKTTFMGVNIDFRDYPKVYDAYVRYAGNELKDQANGLGAKDFLDAVVSGKAAESTYYGGIYSDGAEGGKAAFIRNTITRYRKAAQEMIMAERDQWPEFVEMVNQRRNTLESAKMPKGVTLPREVTDITPPPVGFEKKRESGGERPRLPRPEKPRAEKAQETIDRFKRGASALLDQAEAERQLQINPPRAGSPRVEPF